MCSSWEFCSRLLVEYPVRQAKHLRVINLSKPHNIFSFRRIMEQGFCPDMFLDSPQIPVERFSRRQIGHAQGHCSEDGREGFGRLDLLEFPNLISIVLYGLGGQKTGVQLRTVQHLRDSLPQVSPSNSRLVRPMPAVGRLSEGSSSQVLPQVFFHLAVSHGNYPPLPNERQEFKSGLLSR
jgi:hypothetical protein